MFLKKTNHLRGMTLVELMIGLGISGIIIIGIASYLSQQGRVTKQIESNLRMTTIATRIKESIMDTSVILQSLASTSPGNIKLKNCVTPKKSNLNSGDAGAIFDPVEQDWSTWCDSTDPQKQVPFDLILPIRGLSPSLANLDKFTIAGDENRPVRYRLLDGTQCRRGESDPKCSVTAKAFFWATCPAGAFGGDSNAGAGDIQLGIQGGNLVTTQVMPSSPQFNPTSCPTAQTIHVRYQITYEAPPHLQGEYSLRIANIPDDRVFRSNPTFGALTIPVNTIPAININYMCPKNSTILKITNGIPTCACMPPFRPDPPSCDPTLMACPCVDTDSKCLPNERYRGFDGPSGKIKCCEVFCHDTIVDSSSQNKKGCKTGGWIESISPKPIKFPRTPEFKNGRIQQPLPDPPGPSGEGTGCSATEPCAIGKWGGTCNNGDEFAPAVKCTETFKCCYDYVPSGAGGSFPRCTLR